MPRPRGKYEMFFGLDLTDEQEAYVDSIFDNRITFVDAKAGTGKTTLAVASARIIKDMNEGKNKKSQDAIDLYYLFSPVQEGRIGFLPGDQGDKELPYRQPLMDALEEIDEDPNQAIFDMKDDPYVLKQRRYWVFAHSHVYMRGTNKKKCVVIIDEAQNWTKAELKKTLTRLHDDVTVIVIGHRGQCDLKDPKQSGFVEYMEWFRNKPYCGVHELTKNFRGEMAQHADDLPI